MPHLNGITNELCALPGAFPDPLLEVACLVTEWGVPASRIHDWARGHLEMPFDTIATGVRKGTERTHEQANAILALPELQSLPENERIRGALNLVAWAAYDGKLRKSGTPFYMHPRRAAAMSFHVANELRSEGHPLDDVLIEAFVAAALFHDALEEGVTLYGPHDSSKPYAKFTPRLINELLTSGGSPYGDNVSHAIRLCTHYISRKHPWVMPYAGYILRGRQDLFFCSAKIADIKDNRDNEPMLIDPIGNREGMFKTMRKKGIYTQSLRTICQHAGEIIPPQVNGEPIDISWAPLFLQRLAAIKPEQIPSILEQFSAYMPFPIIPTA